ncbi:MAG TPA: sulfotransferase [Acidimicrobiia bacterium]|jgi:hypothetical protein
MEAEATGHGPSPVRVGFIAGTSWSGSTLLEQALAQIEGCVSVGELYWLWHPDWPAMTCECGREFQDCDFWQAVLAQAYGPRGDQVRGEVRARSNGFLFHSIVPTLARSSSNRPSTALAELASMVEPVYQAVAAATDAATVVDASKSGLWGLAISHARGVDLRLVHLVRDPLGFVDSDMRTRDLPRLRGDRRRGRHPSRSLATWFMLNVEAEILRRRVRDDVVVLYEDFASTPSEVAQQVADVVGLEDAAMPFERNTLVVRRSGHAIGGNPRRPRVGPTAVVPNRRPTRSLPRTGRMLRGAVTPMWNHYRRCARPAGTAMEPR